MRDSNIAILPSYADKGISSAKGACSKNLTEYSSSVFISLVGPCVPLWEIMVPIWDLPSSESIEWLPVTLQHLPLSVWKWWAGRSSLVIFSFGTLTTALKVSFTPQDTAK